MTDKAIGWVRQQKALMPDKPFFMYFAPGATHAPHHVPTEWSDKYKGRFDEGWDALREETLARQKELGVIPPDAELTARHEEIPAWDDMPDELKPVLARQMEVYAGFLEHTDHHVGRLVDALEDLGVLEDTLVYYIIGDNGACAEGTVNGTFNETFIFNGAAALETPEFMAARIDEFGTPDGVQPLRRRLGARHGHAVPVDEAGRLALGRHAQRHDRALAERLQGAGRDPLAVPPRDRRRADRARGRRPAGADVVNGVQQQPIEGVSMRYSFDDADAAERHETQYFEMFCNRGIYHQGWTAVTRHSHAVGDGAELPPFDDDVWELYDTNTDWSQAHDLAAEQPEKLAELQQLFGSRRPKYNVLPLDDRRIERFNPDLAGRPQLIRGNTQLLFGGMGRLTENSVLNIKNKSHAVTAEVEVPEGGAEGVIIAQGGAFAGWSLYPKDGQPDVLLQPVRPAALQGRGRHRRSRPATHQVRMEFAYDGGGLGKGGTVTLYRRRRAGRRGPRRGHRPDDLLRRRDRRRRPRHRLAGQRRLRAARRASSPARSTGCRSTSARTPRTPTT